MLSESIKDRICDMLSLCSGSSKSCLFPPTILYNEGWMLRLVLDWFASQGDAVAGHPLCVPTGCRWYSEALLPSRFKPRKRVDRLAESYTHADGAIGHFDIGSSGRGDLRFRPDGTHLIIVEAKMFSPLSAGTKNAPQYNQAARNIACLANILSLSPSHRLQDMTTLGFYVLAPESQIKGSVFADAVKAQTLRGAVAQRISQYEGEEDYKAHEEWFRLHFEPLLQKLESQPILLSWEEVIHYIAGRDASAGAAFSEFYELCKKYNPKPKFPDSK